LEELNIKSIKPLDIQIGDFRQDFCFAVKKGDAALLKKLNEGLSIVIANKKYDEIHLKWFGPQIQEELSVYDVLKIILYTLIPLAFVLSFIFIFVLRNQVKKKTASLKEEIEHRKEQELQKELYGMVLKLFHHYENRDELTRKIIDLIKDYSKCSAVGIRLKSGHDYPYHESSGFSETHLKYENSLCHYDKSGNIVVDKNLNPILDCMCGNIIMGRFDTSLPFFTPYGSFWTNSTTELLATTTEEDRQARTRNRCNGEGYESVALIPIKGDDKNIGILQLNDFETNRFTLDSIRFYEELASAIGITLIGKQAEEELNEKKEELDRYFNYSLDLLCITNTEGKFIKLNPEWANVLGYELDELLGKKFFDYVHNDDIDITLDAMQQLKANEEILNFVNRYRCKDGTYKWIEWRSKLIGTSIYAVARDITEAKLAKDEMIKSIELFKQIFDSSPAATVLSEIETGKYIDVNNSFERILGYTKEETIGKTSNELKIWPEPDEREKFVNKIMINGGINEEEFCFRTKNGRVINTLVTAKILTIADNKFILSIVSDITEKKRANEAIIQSQEMLSKLAERVPGVVYQYRLYPDGRSCFPYSSNGMYEIYEVSPEEVKYDATPVFGRLHPDDYEMIVSTINESARTLGFFNSEYRVLLPKQGLRWRLCNAKPEKLEDGSILWYGIINDITERKETEAELAQHRYNLEQLVKERTEEIDSINKQLLESLDKEKELSSLKNRFISITSHEFRTPLTSILTSTELLQKYQNKWSADKVEKHFDRVKNSISNLTKLLDDVLTINRAESGRLKFEPQQIDLYETCNNIIYKQQLTENADIEFTFNFLAEKRAYLLDPKQLELILNNLLSNAVKYTNKKGMIELSIITNGSVLQIIVSDNGIGIPEEDKPRLFESFHRAGNTANIQGTGLGLSIVKNAVDLHRGKITFESKINKGTKFTVEIPITDKL